MPTSIDSRAVSIGSDEAWKPAAEAYLLARFIRASNARRSSSRRARR